MEANNTNKVLFQLQQAYSNLQNTKQENSTLNSPSFQSLDYGEKLIVNHNILKDLISIVDSKIAARQAKRSIFLQSKEEKKEKIEKIQEKRQDQYQLKQKLVVVRQKLKQIITFINNQTTFPEKNKKKETELANLKEISSHYQPSLQYSRDPSQLLQISKEKGIIIDKSKLQQAKEVISHEVLHPFHTNRSDKSERSEVDQGYYLKCSLEKISEVQSGQQVTEKEISKVHSRTNSKDPNISLKMHTQPQDLDQTGKYILSTINKKTVSTTTLQKNKKESISQSQPQSQILKEVPSSQERDSIQNSIKKNKFWLKNEKKSIQAYTQNTVVSREELQEIKSPQKHNNNSKHFPKNKIEGKPRSSKQPLQTHNLKNNTETNNSRSPSKIVQNSTIQEVQSSQMIPLSYNPSVITNHSQHITFSQEFAKHQSPPIIRIQRQPTMPLIRESRIIEEIKSQKRAEGLQRSQSLNRQIPQKQNIIPIKIAPQPTSFRQQIINPNFNISSPQIISQRPQIVINVPQRTESVEMRPQSPPPRSVNRQQRSNIPLHTSNQHQKNVIYREILKEDYAVSFQYQNSRQSSHSLRNAPSPKKFNFADQLRLIQNQQNGKIQYQNPQPNYIPPKPPKPSLIVQNRSQPSFHPQQRRENIIRVSQEGIQTENRSRSKRRGIQRTYLPVS